MSYIKFGVVVLVAAGCVALAYSYVSGRGTSDVEVIHPLRGPAVTAVYATGTVEPTIMVPIAAKTTARLVALEADEGASVVKGQVLARLDSSELQKTLTEMEAAADLAQKEYDRRAALLQKKVVSEGTLDQALSSLRAARARVEQTKAGLENLTLIAPEDGTIIRRDGEVGAMITTGPPVFWLQVGHDLRVTAEVDEEDIAGVKVGQQVALSADAFPTQVFDGTVQSITPKGDPVSRSYRVRVSLGPDTPLMIGMTAEANIILNKNDNALLVPASAVQDGSLWVVTGDKTAEKKTVTIGARTSDVVEITSGLDEGATLVRHADQMTGVKGPPVFRPTEWKVP